MTPAHDEQSIEARLREMISAISGHKHEFSRATELYADLSLSGDDAAELLKTVSDEFGTSFQGMSFQSHFPIETDAILPHWGRLLFRQKSRFKSFTFGHLLMVVGRGRWFEPQVPAA